MKRIELINPKTGARRMVPTEGASAENRLNCLKRAGFVPAATYKAPKKKVEKPEPTLAEKVEEEAVKVEVDGVEKEAEIATHGEGESTPEYGESGEGLGEDEPKVKDEPDVSTNDDPVDDKPESDSESEKEPDPEKRKPFGRSRKKKSEDK